MGATRIIFATTFAALASFSGIAYVDGQCNLKRVPEQCDPGYNEMWQEAAGEHRDRTCCNPNIQGYSAYSSVEQDCRYTTCQRTSACSVCSTFRDRYVKGEKLEYDEMLREPCTTPAGQDGVMGLCCPVNSTRSRLVSTEGAESHEFPHMARLKLPQGNCGGTIYNKRFIVTAAHCVVWVPTGELSDMSTSKVLLGTNMDDNESPEYLYKVKRAIAHPDYSRWSFQPEFQKQGTNTLPRTWNDIALLELDRDIKFGPNVKSLEIAPKEFDPFKYADNVISAGWGRNEDLKGSEHLHKVHLQLRTDKECIGTYPGPAPFSGFVGFEDVLLCAGGIMNGKWGAVTREGDSGGPGICKGAGGTPILCGVVSMGGYDDKCVQLQDEKNCAPTAFAEVAQFNDWIKQEAGQQDPGTFYKPSIFGKPVPRGKYPHQVHITSQGGKSCGGTLLSQTAVLTAAHCILSDSMSPYPGIQITTDINDLNGQGQTFGIAQLALLQGFQRVGSPIASRNQGKHVIMSENFYKNDLAILKLNGRANIDPSKVPELPPDNYSPEFGKEVAYFRDDAATKFAQLMSRKFRFLDMAECQRRMSRLSNLGKDIKMDQYDDLLCGVEVYSGGSTCDRELGGGVICKGQNGKDMLCGIQTFRLCDYSLPNGFVNVGMHKSFIEPTVKQF